VPCALANEVLKDLRTLSQASGSAEDASVSNAVSKTVKDLRKLSDRSTNAKIAGLAASTSRALEDLFALAKTDPSGRRPSTKQKASRLGQHYLEDSNELRKRINGICD